MHHPRGDPAEKEAAPALARTATTPTRKSTGALDKYDWIYTVFGDPKVSPVEAKVLAYPVLRYLRRGEDTFSVRLATVAERCAVSERQTRRAYASAIGKGYLQIVTERRRGASGSSRQYRIAYPEVPDAMSATQADTLSATYRTSCPKVPDMTNSSTSENATPIRGLNRGLEEGIGPPAPNPLDEEPPRYCPRHPAGTSENCPACGDARTIHNTWKANHMKRNREELDAHRQAVDACNCCDSSGLRRNADGTDKDRPVRCDHKPFSPWELEQAR